jgi:hypothetical protein
MTPAHARPFAATTVAAHGLRSVATAIPGRRSDATTVRTHQDLRETTRVEVSAGMDRRGVATVRRTRHEEATDRRTHVAAAMTAPVRHFGATTA